jgi:serine/threonine protein kinase
LYAILTRTMPFPDPTQNPTGFRTAIESANYGQGPLDRVQASSQFRDLLGRLLTPNPAARPPVEGILNHPFYGTEHATRERLFI